MLFSSLIFLFGFLPFTIIVYFALRKTKKLKNRFLLLMSLFFYGWGEPIYVFLMIGCILGNYCFGLLVDHWRPIRKKANLAIVLMLVFNLGILAIFKYSGFFISNLNGVFNLNWAVPEIALPIGISFFTFQGISYVLDVYRQKGEPLKNPLDVGLYISFFPQLIAGPIVRYQTIAAEMKERKENLPDFASGVSLFIVGLGKKVLLANNFALVADKAFGTPSGELSVAFAWLGAIAYTLQIYFDFGGYSDMAIGLGRMFGFHFNINFNYPYLARSVSDFWRRWHISLGSWFRDYVYFPLGGSRVNSKWKLVRNLFVVWILTGIWHGANWTFFVWGLYYFVFLAIEKLFNLDKKMQKVSVLSNLLVLFIIVCGWVIFRADTLTDATSYLGVMMGFGENPWLNSLGSFYYYENQVLLPIGILCCLPLKQWLLCFFCPQDKLEPAVTAQTFLQTKAGICVQSICAIGLAVIFVTAVSFLAKGSYNPFIYFNF